MIQKQLSDSIVIKKESEVKHEFNKLSYLVHSLKAFSVLHSNAQHLLQFVVTLVRWQVQSVETALRNNTTWY